MPNSVEVAIKVFLSLLMLIFFSLTRNSIELHCNLVWCSVILVSVNQAGKVALKWWIEITGHTSFFFFFLFYFSFFFFFWWGHFRGIRTNLIGEQKSKPYANDPTDHPSCFIWLSRRVYLKYWEFSHDPFTWLKLQFLCNLWKGERRVDHAL